MTGNWATKLQYGLKSKSKIVAGLAAGLSVNTVIGDSNRVIRQLWRHFESAFKSHPTATSERCSAACEVQSSARTESVAVERISLDSDRHSLQLVSRSGWLLSSSLCMLFMGLMLLGSGVYFFNYAVVAGSLFWLFGGLSSAAGLIFLWLGFWSWGLRLEVYMADDEVRVRRSFFDKPLYQQSVELPEAERIFTKRTSETLGYDEKGHEYYSLVFRRQGVTHQLAEGIAGRYAAENLLGQVRSWVKQHRQQLT